MLNIRILVAFLVATTISNTTLLTNSFRIVTTTSIHPPPIIAIRHHQQHDPTTTTTTSTRLYQRPLTAMYYGNDDAATTSTTMTLLEEVIRNIRVQEIDDSIDILHMPVFGSSDHGDTNHHSHHHSHHHHNHHLNYYPIASMMQGSAGYIAQHAGSIAVFHLPEEQPDSVLRDIGLCYLLGLKIILVVSTDCYHHHQQQQHTNGPKSLRQMEETLGYLRTEVERKLNRFLCMDQHVSTTHGNGKDRPNVVSGNNFCTGQRFSPDAIAGKATHVSSYKIQQSLHQNDNILVLTNVILDKTGDDWVCTDGCQLASKVAVELQASKLILLRNTPKLLTFNDEHVQDIPLSLAKAILEAQVGGGDSATSHESHDGGESALTTTTTLPPPDAFWRELHWAAYAVEKGTSRAHLVNAPLDGALLEELFTAVNGANTCLYHDDELLQSHNNNNNKTMKNHHPSKAAMTYSDFVPSPRNEDKNNEEDLYYYERRRDNHIRYF